MPRQRDNFVRVPIKRLEFLHGSDVKQLDLLVPRRREQPVPVHVPLKLLHRVFVHVERAQAVGCAGVP